MKKLLFLTIILAFSAFSFAQEEDTPAEESSSDGQAYPNEFLFIEGTAERNDHLEFFLQNFRIEAAGAGYTVIEKKEDAAYTFKFHISAHLIEDEKGVFHPAPSYDNQFIIRISLIDNANDWEILFFDFYFSNLDEMYEYNQALFQMATIYIPPDRKDIFLPPDTRWQNKWFYISAAVDYPISFYALLPTGLHAGQAAYNKDANDKITELQLLNHIILPQPGLSLGVELQFLNFLSLGLNFQLNFGDTKSAFFLNMAAGGQLKANIKTEDFLLQPYLAFAMPLAVSPLFNEFPQFSAGGGFQAGVRGGSSGSFFIDVNFMYSLGSAFMQNIYGNLAPYPSQIEYNHFVFGIGFGYKFGFLNRQ